MAKYLRTIAWGKIAPSLLPTLKSAPLNMLAELLEKNLVKYVTNGIAKLVIELSDLKNEHEQIADRVDVLAIRFYVSAEALGDRTAHERANVLLGILQDAILAVARAKGWQTAPIVQAYQAVMSQGIEWKGRWGKAVRQPEGNAVAWLEFDYFHQILVTLYVTEDHQTRTIPLMRLPGTMEAMKRYVGPLGWQSRSVLRIDHPNDRDWWTIDLDTRSVDFHSKRVEENDAHGQYDVGMIYENGELVPKNRAKAVYWLKRSAQQGFKRAQNALDSIAGMSEDRQDTEPLDQPKGS